jgi:uncharacterized protein YjbI with pentapeptide repeats
MSKYTKEEVLAMVRAGKSLEGADLNGINLAGTDLSGAILPNAELIEADLRGANLFEANLSGVELYGSNLTEADLRGVNLKNADLCFADLSKANLSEADLSKIDLSGAYLTDAYLIDSNLIGANLRGALLTNANLNRAKISMANLSGANFSAANLNEADLNGSKLDRGTLRHAKLKKSILYGTGLRETDLFRADLSGSYIIEAELIGADLREADLTAAILRDTNLASADLEGANLNKADISGANIFHVKTPGWKISDIKCTHIYSYYPFSPNKEDRIRNREKSRRNFAEGEFETVYKSMPTIELLFRDKFSFTDDLRLLYIQDKLKRELPDATITLKKKEWVGKDLVITFTVEEEEYAKEVAAAIDRLYADKRLEEEFIKPLKEAFNKKILQSLPGLDKGLVRGFGQGEKIGTPVVNNNITIIYQSGDGHTAVHADTVNKSAIGSGSTINIFQNYENNKTTVDKLLKELRVGLTEDRKGLVEQFTKALSNL